MSAQTITRRLTQADLAKLYAAGEKVVMFTCYDASFARLLDGAGVEVMLIGDSLGNVIQGHDTTLPVTVSDIAYHTAAVKRGSDRPFIIADMPFGSYQESPEQAFRNAARLMAGFDLDAPAVLDFSQVCHLRNPLCPARAGGRAGFGRDGIVINGGKWR